MIIYMLAAAMTVAMLIATVLGIHEETQRLRYQEQKARTDCFGRR